MPDVLVDSTVWVEFFRRGPAPPWRPALVALIERDAVVVIDVIIAELLYGVRTALERAAVLDLAGGTRSARVDRDTWIQSGDLGRLWQNKGRTLSLIDCMIATVAMRDGYALWTLDEDFAPLASEGGLVRFVPG